jgi:Domain of unknown function (DUF6754)
MKGLKVIISVILAIICANTVVHCRTIIPTLEPRFNPAVFDHPYDDGGSVIIMPVEYWGDIHHYPVTVYRIVSTDSPWIKVKTFEEEFDYYVDSNLINDVEYEYEVVFHIQTDSILYDKHHGLGKAKPSNIKDTDYFWPDSSFIRTNYKTTQEEFDLFMAAMAYRAELLENLKPKPALFKKETLPVFIGTIISIIIFLLVTFIIRKKGVPTIRKVAGLNAVDDAVGRATEMGKPLLFTPGWGGDIQRPTTIAALNILNLVASKTAEYNCDLIFPTHDPVIMSAAEETIQSAYINAGHPDLYNPDNIYYTTSSQLGYAAAVDGAIIRNKPATVMLLGTFEGEALILAETANTAGAMQIAGTDSTIQLAFFLVACDYTLIGEELFAASGYLSKDEKIIASIKAQDYMKIIITAIMIAGSVAATFGFDKISEWIM